jgi:plasmid stabilization system protein ParE
MTAPFQLTPQAAEDLDGIWWFIEEGSAEAANRVEAEIIATCRKLAAYPFIGHRPVLLIPRHIVFDMGRSSPMPRGAAPALRLIGCKPLFRMVSKSIQSSFEGSETGSTVAAKCSCGVEVEIPIGGGMRNFATTCYFPFLCEACHNIVTVNLLAPAHVCPGCKSPAVVPYDNPRLSESPGKNVVTKWNLKAKIGRDLVLTDGNYLCPKCCNLSLHFRDTGLRWD